MSSARLEVTPDPHSPLVLGEQGYYVTLYLPAHSGESAFRKFGPWLRYAAVPAEGTRELARWLLEAHRRATDGICTCARDLEKRYAQ